MTNSRAKTGNLVLLDKHLATGTEADYTYTNTLDMKVKYREIQIIITGKATASFALEMVLSAHTSYTKSYLLMDTTTVSGALETTVSEGELLPITLLDGGNPFHGRITISLNDVNDAMYCICTFTAPHEGQIHTIIVDETAQTTITSIKIQTSTSTWVAGTEISIYGLQR